MRQTFDRRSVLGLAVGSAAGAVFVSSARPTYAAGTAYKATLSGTTEVPPTTSTGKGTATVTYDAGTKMVTWEGDFSGLSGAGDCGAHPWSGRSGQKCRRHRSAVAEGRPLYQPVQRLGDIGRRQGRRPCRGAHVGTGLREHPHRSEPRRRAARPTRESLKRAGLLRWYQLRFCVTRRSCVSWTGGYFFVRKATLGAC